jgi:signal peptidase I
VSTRERLRRWRVRREGRALVRHVRSVLRRNGYRVPKDLIPGIEAAADRLDAAVSAKDHDAVCVGITEVDELAERHLFFARKSTFREYADSIGVALLVALFLRTFVVEAFKIPSGSMIPTMEVGDHIFVNKFIYGLRVPGIDDRKFFEWRSPKRGEVIVFVYPKDTSKDFIKRVVAIAGDTVEVHNDVVYVNGTQVPHRMVDDGPYRYYDFNESLERWDVKYARRYEEELGGQKFMTLVDTSHPTAGSDYGPYEVPEGHVFVLGDNRSNSHDSRYWGSVPLENIRGKAMVIWWSTGKPEGIRFQRIGKAVD